VSGQLIRLDLFGVFVPLLDVSVLLFLIYQVISKNFSLKKYLSNKYLLIFIVSLVISNLANIPRYSLAENLTGSLYLLRFVMYTLILGIDLKVVTGNWPVTKNKIIKIIGLTIALIGIFQFIFLPDLRFLQYQNWDDHLGRLTFPFLDPSFSGAILLVFMIHLIYSERSRSFTTKIIIIFIELLAIFLTFSRATWLVTGVVLFLILIHQSNSLFKKIIWGIGGVGVIGIIFIFLLSPQKPFSSYGNKITRSETVKSRINSVGKAISIWQQNPIFGVGFNNYKTYQLKNNFEIKNKEDNRGESSVENSFVFVLATSGIFGFATFLFWVINLSPFKGGTFKGSEKYILFSIILGSLFNNLFFYPFILLIILICLGKSIVIASE
jgi:O-antigen ligase